MRVALFNAENIFVGLRAVVVAQLVERSILLPEVQGSNPVIGKIYIEHLFACLLSTVLKRRK